MFLPLLLALGHEAHAGDALSLTRQVSLTDLSQSSCKAAARSFTEVSGLDRETIDALVVVESSGGTLAIALHRDSQQRLVVHMFPAENATRSARTVGTTTGFSATEELESAWATIRPRLTGEKSGDQVALSGELRFTTRSGSTTRTLDRTVRYGQCWVFA